MTNLNELTNEELTQLFNKVSTELKVARQIFDDIKELNDYNPCPEARAELQITIDKFNTIGTEVNSREIKI